MTSGSTATPQRTKLGVNAGCRLLLDHAPDGWRLDDPPPVADVGPGEPADVVIAFVRELADLPARVADLAPRIRPDGALWIAWPRKAAGHRSDVTDNAIRAAVLPRGLVDVKIAAIDADWSGLKVVWRENRLTERKF